MCDTGGIMAQQMDDQIQSGINERDWCYQRIEELENSIKLLAHLDDKYCCCSACVIAQKLDLKEIREANE